MAIWYSEDRMYRVDEFDSGTRFFAQENLHE